MRRARKRKRDWDQSGIVLLFIGMFICVGALLVISFAGILLGLVTMFAGIAVILAGIIIDSYLRRRYPRIKSPSKDQPKIVISEWANTDAIEPLNTYKHLGNPYGNFWVRFVYLVRELINGIYYMIGLGLVITVIGFIATQELFGAILYLFFAFLLMIPPFFIFIFWMLLNSYIFRERMHLFPEGHPYQEKVLWNVEPESLICGRGPTRRPTKMDVEISHHISRRSRGKRISLSILYPLHFYRTDDFLNHFHLPCPIEHGDEGLLRIHRLGLPFDTDYSDVYLRLHFISTLRFGIQFLVWIIIGIILFVSYFWFIFTPLLLQFATRFGILV